jgi:hypothetical protein
MLLQGQPKLQPQVSARPRSEPTLLLTFSPAPIHHNRCDTTECDDYDGCKWSGDFAYIDHKSYDWVANHSIVAFFALKDNPKYGGKNLLVLDTQTGINFTVRLGRNPGFLRVLAHRIAFLRVLLHSIASKRRTPLVRTR